MLTFRGVHVLPNIGHLLEISASRRYNKTFCEVAAWSDGEQREIQVG